MAKFIEPISCYTRQYIQQNAAHIATLEKMYRRPITIAERGNQILVNSGVKTSALDMNAITHKEDLINHIKSNCAENESIFNHGLNVLI